MYSSYKAPSFDAPIVQTYPSSIAEHDSRIVQIYNPTVTEQTAYTSALSVPVQTGRVVNFLPNRSVHTTGVVVWNNCIVNFYNYHKPKML